MASRLGFGKHITTSKVPQAPSLPAPVAKTETAVSPMQKRSLADYIQGRLSQEQTSKLQRWSQKSRKHGPVGHMRISECHGMECPFVSQCPLAKNDVTLPLNQECPVEEHLVDTWVEDAGIAFDVDEQHKEYPFIMALLGELALILLVQTRLGWVLSKDPAPISTEVMGMNSRGEAMEVRRIHPGLEHLDKIVPKKIRILRELIQTPRSKIEAGRMGWKDPSSRAAEAQAKAEKLKALKEREDGPIRFKQLRLGGESTEL